MVDALRRDRSTPRGEDRPQLLAMLSGVRIEPLRRLHMVAEEFHPEDPEAMERMRAYFSPQQVDQLIRQAIQLCWMVLPPDQQNVEEVERQIRRIMDRALRNLREDADSFGSGRG